MRQNNYNRKRGNHEDDYMGNAYPIAKLFPNIITLLALCSGLTALRFAFFGRWESAVLFVIIAAFLDSMDGRIARMLNATSRFGAELDSLCDSINFGVVPAIILYLWQTKDIRGFGWGSALFIVVCMVIRLARFNTIAEDAKHDNKIRDLMNNFFVGIPAPAAAILLLCPVILDFEADIALPTLLVIIYVFIIAGLAASRLPTFSPKAIKIKPRNIAQIMIIIGIFIIGFIVEKWKTVLILSLIYLITIPFSIIKYNKFLKEEKS